MSAEPNLQPTQHNEDTRSHGCKRQAQDTAEHGSLGDRKWTELKARMACGCKHMAALSLERPKFSQGSDWFYANCSKQSL